MERRFRAGHWTRETSDAVPVLEQFPAKGTHRSVARSGTCLSGVGVRVEGRDGTGRRDRPSRSLS